MHRELEPAREEANADRSLSAALVRRVCDAALRLQEKRVTGDCQASKEQTITHEIVQDTASVPPVLVQIAPPHSGGYTSSSIDAGPVTPQGSTALQAGAETSSRIFYVFRIFLYCSGFVLVQYGNWVRMRTDDHLCLNLTHVQRL